MTCKNAWMYRRLMIAISTLGVAGSLASLAVADPTPAQKPVARPAALAVPSELVIEREHRRISATIPVERRSKMQEAARALAKDIDAQLSAGKAMTASDAAAMARSAGKRVGIDFSTMSIDDAVM